MDNGKVILVGAGPGDPGLITLKGIEYIKTADVIIYDRLVSQNLLMHANERCELIYAGKENTEGGSIQEHINYLLVKKASENKTVVRLKGGDPFLFGRGGEEIEALSNENINFEVVPGVTSAISVPAYAGIPVTHRDFASSLHVFTGHKKGDYGEHELDFENIAKLEGTLVFMMSMENLESITGELIKYGKNENTPAAVINNGTTVKQKIVTGVLETISNAVKDSGLKPPCIVVIGDVVPLSEKFSWFGKKTLSGKKIVVTRSIKQSSDFCRKFDDLGAETLTFPLIEIERNDILLPDLENYSGLIFNSANAVRFFFNCIKDIRALSGLKIGVVGNGTRDELKKHKVIADFIPERFTVNDAVEKAAGIFKKGERALVITSNLSPFDEKSNFEKYGINFKRLEVYKTLKINKSYDELTSLFEDKPDVITFLSSSSVDAFFESTGDEFRNELEDMTFATIGPETSKTLAGYGYKSGIEAIEYTSDGVIDAIEKYFSEDR